CLSIVIFYRRLKLLIDKLKKSSEKQKADSTPGDCCSETDTEADVCMSNSESDDFCFPKTTYRSETPTPEEELNDDNAPLMSLYQSIKGSSGKITGHKESHTNSTKQLRVKSALVKFRLSQSMDLNVQLMLKKVAVPSNAGVQILPLKLPDVPGH
ncbi:protein BRUSHY, partial [Trifolium medium]|nr:protein BRUSHY [Trifolium medium]